MIFTPSFNAGAIIPQRSGRLLRLRRRQNPAADSSLRICRGRSLSSTIAEQHTFDDRKKLRLIQAAANIVGADARVSAATSPSPPLVATLADPLDGANRPSDAGTGCWVAHNCADCGASYSALDAVANDGTGIGRLERGDHRGEDECARCKGQCGFDFC
jgi:hypothetical protein